ncbi:glycosyltransferase [Croceibacter atlanticus]|uniref:glycosyltransferase n=1 Tax=Croceibacter atlanticus TaxID=313588 RepID=UPI002E0F6B23|nr:glycosyltransferase [Croceibacter atlanticus]
MKIFLIIPTLKQGGAERVMSILANEFYSNGLEVNLVLLADAKDFYSVNKNIDIHRLGFKNNYRLSKIFNEIKLFFKLRYLIKREKPKSILSFGDKYNVLSIIASRFINTKVFISDRSNPVKKLPFLTTLLCRITYPLATGIIAQTQFSKEILFSKIGHKNIKVIPNPVKEIISDNFIKREKIILNVGRLVPEKGQESLIESYNLLTDKSWKLLILGEGPLRKSLESKIRELSLTDNVFLLGAVENVDKWLNKSSVFVFSSNSEGFPNALCEAMSSGLPVISYDCNAGPRDIIKNYYNGILVELNNQEKLAEKITLLINDECLRLKLSQNGKKINALLDKHFISLQYQDFIMKN